MKRSSPTRVSCQAIPVAARLRGQSAYQALVSRGGRLLQLDRNEGRPPPEFSPSWTAPNLENLRRYPQASRVEELLAERWQVEPRQVLVTAGADEALQRVCLAFLEPGTEMVLPSPTFEMLTHYSRWAGAQIRKVPWDGEFPLEQVVAAIGRRTRLIAVVSPNNPTGSILNQDQFEHLAAAARDPLLLIDMAYAEFADADWIDTALRYPNVVVVRTFSKAWGLAGLRVGYAVGSVPVIEALRQAGNPYSIASASLEGIEQLLQGGFSCQTYVQQVRTERSELARMLAPHGRVSPTQANFIFFRHPQAEFIWRDLAASGIAVRRFADNPALGDALRITCPGEVTDFNRLKLQLSATLLRLATPDSKETGGC